MTDSTLSSCSRFVSNNDTVLLIEDGVYGALPDTQAEPLIKKTLQRCKVCVLKEDLLARGYSDQVIAGIDVVDYNDFVDLTLAHDKVQSWY